MTDRAKIILKSGKDQSVMRRHPWIFSGAIKKIHGNLFEGDVVDVYNNKNELLAIGHSQIGSIAVRVLAFEQMDIDDAFFHEKIKKAFELRKMTGIAHNEETNAYRLVFGEGDGLPGVIIDYYNGCAVLQFHSIGMFLKREAFAEGLKAVFGDDIHTIYDKSAKTLPYNADHPHEDTFLLGKNEKGVVLENGLKFNINWVEGQKTGFFLDQRDNRKLVQEYSKGRDVLNTFCYTGGFSVYAMAGGANSVTSVDCSQRAVDLTDENIELNFGADAKHEAIAVDAFEYLNEIENKFDLIILDPPAFAKHGKVLSNALQGYKRINAKAIQQIKPGGILFTFSCSQVVSKENFKKSVFTAAANVGRTVRILHQMTQPVDHPINIFHPEGEYLKGLVLYVE